MCSCTFAEMCGSSRVCGVRPCGPLLERLVGVQTHRDGSGGVRRSYGPDTCGSRERSIASPTRVQYVEFTNSRNATRRHTVWFRNPAHEESTFAYEEKQNCH